MFRLTFASVENRNRSDSQLLKSTGSTVAPRMCARCTRYNGSFSLSPHPWLSRPKAESHRSNVVHSVTATRRTDKE